MAQEYYPANDELRRIVNEIVNEHHSDLGPVRIELVFLCEAPKVAGKIAWARAKKISGLNAWLMSPESEQARSAEPEEFFVIEVVKPIWDQLEEKAKRALIDHELHHCYVNGESGRLSIRPHDLEEFTQIVRRYGLWRDDVKLFVEVGLGQRGLFEPAEPDEEGGARRTRRAVTIGGTA